MVNYVFKADHLLSQDIDPCHSTLTLKGWIYGKAVLGPLSQRYDRKSYVMCANKHIHISILHANHE